MIIKTITLHNFGVYRGRHVIDLTTTPERPVVLVGAANGSGKTSLLDALQLSLYGSRARCSNRGALSYDEFLRRSIHRAVPAHEGAGVEIEFSTHIEGERADLRVSRTWRSTGKGMREDLTVSRNGFPDTALSEMWADFIEGTLPLEISQLFFFDGEKVEALADPDRTSALIQSAVHSLLGVDLIEQLAQDLVALERRKRGEVRSRREQDLMQLAQSRVDTAQSSHEENTLALALQRSRVDRLERDLAGVNEEYRARGGELHDRRADLERQHRQALSALTAHEDAVREVAAGVAPLLTVRPLLEAARDQAEDERRSELARVLTYELESRDAGAVEVVRAVSATAADALEKHLASDRLRFERGADADAYLQLSRPALEELHHLLTSGLNAAHQDIALALTELTATQELVLDAERRLAAIPDPATLVDLIARRGELSTAATEAHTELVVLGAITGRSRSLLDRERAALTRELDMQVDTEVALEAATRTIAYSERTRGILEEFRHRVLLEHIVRIQSAITTALGCLVHKESLVGNLRLDPHSMALDLFDTRGEHITPERLSAGERQLLAVAVMWGLANVSGMTLPTVIDTPLGRLDASHREHLLDRYFPFASHQVILLSTDKEIDPEAYRRIADHVARTYLLEFDDTTQSTTVSNGYFTEKVLSSVT